MKTNDFYYSRLLNHNFRVKVGRNLVGWSGLVRYLGFDRAVHFLIKALRSLDDKVVFRVSSLKVNVVFYVK